MECGGGEDRSSWIEITKAAVGYYNRGLIEPRHNPGSSKVFIDIKSVALIQKKKKKTT